MLFIIISAVHVSGGISAHQQELIKFYVQPWVFSCFPGAVPTHPGKHDNTQGCTKCFISS